MGGIGGWAIVRFAFPNPLGPVGCGFRCGGNIELIPVGIGCWGCRGGGRTEFIPVGSGCCGV